MLLSILTVLGGIGLFLLGMTGLTDGIRNLAGDRIRNLLAGFTKTPFTGSVTGAVTTAVIQSSSATSVMAISFVSAGLLTFPQALGIVFGANIGTTVTGWLVAILGFKLKLGTIALPLIFIGALMRLFGRSRTAAAGWALAGFGLLFVGIDMMKHGMEPFQGVVTPENFPADSMFGRLQLVLIGIAITLVTQSSSAGVAIALVALGAGSISFTQAAAMVIGMDIGTTFTAFLATIGGSTSAKQTGYGQIIYNVMTGVVALILLDPFASFVDTFIHSGGAGNEQVALVAFHTLFNALGVVAILPFARPFSRFIMRIVPERGPPMVGGLEDRLLRDPPSALEAASGSVRRISDRLIAHLEVILEKPVLAASRSADLKAIDQALETVHGYLARVRTDPNNRRHLTRHSALVHATDHLLRLNDRCIQTARIETIPGDARLIEMADALKQAIEHWRQKAGPETVEHLNQIRAQFREERRQYREAIITLAVERQIGPSSTLARLDSVRWLHRVSYHLWRIAFHLQPATDLELVETITRMDDDRDDGD